MLEVHVHQSPSFAYIKGEIFYKTETSDTWRVFIVNTKLDISEQVAFFDGMPIFNKRWDKSYQRDIAVKCAQNWCQLLGLSTEAIKIFEGKDSKAYKEFVEFVRERYDIELKAAKKRVEELEKVTIKK